MEKFSKIMDVIDLKPTEDRANKLADKMNKITARFKENLDIADEMDISGNDILEYAEDKTKDLPKTLDDSSYLELINLNTLLQDFDYIRKTLRGDGKKIKTAAGCGC